MLFTTGAFQCKFVMATANVQSERDSEVIVKEVDSDTESEEYISGTEDES